MPARYWSWPKTPEGQPVGSSDTVQAHAMSLFLRRGHAVVSHGYSHHAAPLPREEQQGGEATAL